MTRDEAIAHIRSVERRCRGLLPAGARKEVVRLLAEGDAEAARKVDEANRQPCGADFNEIIIAGPWDGEEHAYQCPKCGITGSYRAPRLVMASLVN